MKQFAGDIIVLHMCSKDQNHMMYGSWDTEWDRQKILMFWAHFLPFYHPPNKSKKSKFWTKMKKMSGDIILLHIHVCHKWTLYDIWFLRCKVWLTESFVILYHFLPFQPTDNSENWKKHLDIWPFYTFAP